MREQIRNSEIPGAVTLVADRSKVTHMEAIGHADPGAQHPLRTDSMFWIASMTMPIAAVAVLTLHERGKLSIDDPVSKYIPDFAGLKTRDGTPVAMILRHMLTHTSGLPEATGEEQKAIVLI